MRYPRPNNFQTEAEAPTIFWIIQFGGEKSLMTSWLLGKAHQSPKAPKINSPRASRVLRQRSRGALDAQSAREFKEHKNEKQILLRLVIFFLFVFFFVVSHSRFVSPVPKPVSQLRLSHVELAMVTPFVLGVVNNSVDTNVDNGVQVDVA